MAAVKKLTPAQLKGIEDKLVGMYDDVFTKRELLTARGKAFGVIGNTRSAKTGKWLSETVTDSDARADLIGHVIDRITAKFTTDIGY